ncbi:hypothetical protein GCM10028777_17860 [Angustibacter speluncae]
MLRPHARDAGPTAPATTDQVGAPGERDDLEGARSLDVRGGRVLVDAAGGLASLVADDGTEYGAGTGGRGLVRIAAPLPDYPSHYVELGTHGGPQVHEADGGLVLVHDGLTTPNAELDVRVEVRLRPAPEGLVLSTRVENRSDLRLPQVAFPQLLGLRAVGGVDGTRVRMSRGTTHPLRDLAMSPDDATFLDIALQRYYGYGAFELSMKWLDFGSAAGGLTMYGRDPRYSAQGLLVERPGRTASTTELRWIHYPLIEPRETWESGDFVVLLHPGDWYAGARAFAEFAAKAYPYDAPQHVREALAIRSMWAAVRNADRPEAGLDRIPELAAEVADPDLGVAELVVWHWWQKNGLPIILDPRLGTEDDLRAALARCRELGVPVSLFVSHHLLRDTDETPSDWRHLNAARQPVQDDWTYGRDFLPRWRVQFMGTHAMMRGSALAEGWRAAALAEYERLLDLGATSVCFDQFWSWFEPNFSEHRDARPDAEGDRLLELGRDAHALVRSRDPRGTFSGEMPSEMKVPVLDYTWEWRNAEELDDDAPFRVVFPQVRLNANVNEHPRGALYGFAEGGLLNLMPGNMHSHRLADHPDLLRTVRELAALRRRFLRYFTEGEFRHAEGLRAEHCLARAYTHGDDVLVVVANPGDEAVRARVRVDPTTWGGAAVDRAAALVAQDGTAMGCAGVEPLEVDLDPDTLVVLELTA